MRFRTLARAIFFPLVVWLSSHALACDYAREAVAELSQEWLESREGEAALLTAARELRRCPSASIEDRIRGYEWERFLLVQQGDLDRRVALDKYFLDHFAEHVDVAQRVRVRRNVAVTLRRAGKLIEAMEHLVEALEQSSQLPAEDRANILLSVSTHYSHLGDHDRALDLASEAEALVAREPGLMLARAMVRQAQIIALNAFGANEVDSTALRWGLAQAVSARDIILSDESVEATMLSRRAAFAEMARSRLLMALGRTEEAAEAARMGVQFARHAGADSVEIQLLLVLVDAEMGLQRYYEALGLLNEVSQLGDEGGAPIDRAELLLGRVHLALGDTTTASSHFLSTIAIMEAQRAELGVSEWSRLWFQLNDSAYRDYAALMIRQGRFEEAFGWLDAERARFLRDSRSVMRRDGGRPAGIDRLAAELRAVQDSIRLAGPNPPHDLTNRRARLQAEMARLTDYTPTEVYLDLPTLQNRLSESDRVVVSYFLDEPAHAFVVRADTFLAIPLVATREAVLAEISAMALPSSPEDLLETGAPLLRPEPLRRLYELLFAPLESFVPPGAPVTIIADRGTSELPFGMLLSGNAEPYDYGRWPFLVYRNAFSMELAAALMLEENQPGRHRWPIVAFGRSDFQEFESSGILGDVSLVPLPHVQAELQAIRRNIGGAVIARDEEARESDLYRLLPDAAILHFASHSFISDEAPLYSAIVLSPDSNKDGPDGDGVLHLYELAGRKLDAALVVLSGCSTARGRARLTEGVIGLHYGFRAAGAHASVATLWPVEDAAMAMLMSNFYRHLARGLRKDEALQQAQIEYLESADRSRSNPFYWAGIVLAGDPDPISFGRSPLPPAAWLGLGLILLLGSLLTGRLRRSPVYG